MNLETIQIHLNSSSANSYNGNTSSDCNFFLPIIELPNQHQILLSVQSAVIPYSFYNIDASNNLLVYRTDSISNHMYFYISPGNYNANQLAAYLTSNITNLTVTYDIITNKFHFVNSLENFVFYPLESTCFSLLGFTSDVLYSTSYANQVWSYNCCNLLSKQYICIQSNLITGNINNVSDSESNILVSIPVASVPYSLIVYNNIGNFKTNLYSNTLSYVNLKLVDQNNKLLNLNGCDWSVTLQLDVVKFVE